MARSKRPKPDTEATPVAPPATSPDPVDAELEAGTIAFDLDPEPDAPPPADEPGPEHRFASALELLDFEQRAIDGKWFRWELMAATAEVHIGDLMEAVGEEALLQRRWTLAQEAAAKKAGKEFDPRTPMPIETRRRIQALARLKKGVVKNWRGDAFADLPFNQENFIRLWTRSLEFRQFVDSKGIEIRVELEREFTEAGKA